MEKKYEWIITSMDCEPVQGNLNDVVINVHWRRKCTVGIEGEENYYMADIYSDMRVGDPADPNNFIDYDNLTKDDVVSWLQTMTDPTVEFIDETLSKNIDEQINPPVVTLPLPWDNSNENSEEEIIEDDNIEENEE